MLIRADYDASKELFDHSPSFTFPLRNRFIQQGVGVKLIACVTAKPTPKVLQPAAVTVYRESSLEVAPTDHFNAMFRRLLTACYDSSQEDTRSVSLK